MPSWVLAGEHDDRLLVGRGVLLAVRDVRRHVDVVAGAGLDAPFLVVLEEDEDRMAGDDVDARLGLAVMMVGRAHVRPDVALAHPELARAVELARDRLVPAHARRLGGVLAQLVVACVMEAAVPGQRALVMGMGVVAHARKIDAPA